jgi:hypothetical protein
MKKWTRAERQANNEEAEAAMFARIARKEAKQAEEEAQRRRQEFRVVPNDPPVDQEPGRG